MATAASAVPGGSVDLALEGCTVIVTGAGSGIGAATARLTKSALDYLTQSLAGELAPAGIRVNCIAPGPTDTPVHAQVIPHA